MVNQGRVTTGLQAALGTVEFDDSEEEHDESCYLLESAHKTTLLMWGLGLGLVPPKLKEDELLPPPNCNGGRDDL
ncbi:hypothetical protein E2562_031280 [Oryza meyeriana var. granulata]|uniref:Uncharacterized protein n=1 Tax=Oryza meyeriana var. granulata TaxID=110450 RepID=A0A6G1CA49_9ORYZ|nr:hypothetical protein E2562_031280 [Oryza meyeriana var. granulata]